MRFILRWNLWVILYLYTSQYPHHFYRHNPGIHCTYIELECTGHLYKRIGPLDIHNLAHHSDLHNHWFRYRHRFEECIYPHSIHKTLLRTLKFLFNIFWEIDNGWKLIGIKVIKQRPITSKLTCHISVVIAIKVFSVIVHLRVSLYTAIIDEIRQDGVILYSFNFRILVFVSELRWDDGFFLLFLFQFLV